MVVFYYSLTTSTMDKLYIKFSMLTILIGLSIKMIGQQVNTVIVNQNLDISTHFRISQPTPLWGSFADQELSGLATFVNDGVGQLTNGCEPLTNNLLDKIAFIDRGNCPFSTKAVNAQEAGAVAAIICNNTGINTIMNMPANAEGNTVTIPVFAMSAHDCNEIRLYAADGQELQITLAYSCEPLPDSRVIWGDKSGQGDFAGSIGDWKVRTDASSDTSWYWTAEKDLPGTFTTTYAVESSACNGYMAFPSNYYDETGLCLNDATSGNFCVGSLYSPIIDLSDVIVENLNCKLYHDWGYYYAGSTSLISSYDGGLTWPDTIHITLGEAAVANNPEVIDLQDDNCQVTTASVNERGEGIYIIPIPGYQNQGSIQLQFKHFGGYYHAAIDDVQLIDDVVNDIEVFRSFVGRNPAASMPLSQANAIPLHVDIFNAGNNTASEVAIKAEALDQSGNVEWEAINDNFSDQPIDCFLNENSTFEDLFTPTQLGNYKVNYSNVTPGDENLSNDTISFAFEMTETLWRTVAKPPQNDEDGLFRQMFTGLIADEPGEQGWCGWDWAMAYNFHLPNGQGHTLGEVQFGVNFKGTNSGDIKVYLYEWNPTAVSLDPDSNPNTAAWIVAAEDLTLVGCMGENGFGSYENSRPMTSLLGDQSDIKIRMAKVNPVDGEPLLDDNDEIQPLCLKDNQNYSLVFVMNPDTGTIGELDFIAANARTGSAYDLNATNFALENLGRTERYGARVACNLFNGGDFDQELGSINYDRNLPNQPWIEMQILETSCTVSTEEISPEVNNSIEVFPNPASNVLLIDVDFAQVSKKVSFELIDLTGQLVQRLTKDQVKKERFTLSVAELPAGVYTLNARSDNGFAAKKIVITK